MQQAPKSHSSVNKPAQRRTSRTTRCPLYGWRDGWWGGPASLCLKFGSCHNNNKATSNIQPGDGHPCWSNTDKLIVCQWIYDRLTVHLFKNKVTLWIMIQTVFLQEHTENMFTSLSPTSYQSANIYRLVWNSKIIWSEPINLGCQTVEAATAFSPLTDANKCSNGTEHSQPIRTFWISLQRLRVCQVCSQWNEMK